MKCGVREIITKQPLTCWRDRSRTACANARKCTILKLCDASRNRNCTISGHSPVDELHSTENKGDKVVGILLTSPPAGVKPQSFFDSFRGFPVGGESGTEASSLRRACSATATGGR